LLFCIISTLTIMFHTTRLRYLGKLYQNCILEAFVYGITAEYRLFKDRVPSDVA
jgi:hypothetical protein